MEAKQVRKAIFWLSSLVFGSDTVTSRTEITKHLSERNNNDVYLFGILSDANRPVKSNAHMILFPLKFVPGLTKWLYTLALIFSAPFLVALKNCEYIIVDKDTAIVGIFLKLIMPKPKPKVVLDIRSPPLRSKGGFHESYDLFMFRTSVILAKKKFDGITIVTQLMKKEICSEFSINPEFVGVWTSGVSPKLFDPAHFNETVIRKRLGLTDKFVIFYHGSIGRGGVTETIKGIGKLTEQFGDVRLFLMGDTSDEQKLRNLVQETNIQDKVIFHGKVPYTEVPQLIACCDAAIVPLAYSSNWRYQSPLKLVEYLAMEKVVIVTDIPANRQIIGNRKCGIYIKTTAPEEIAEAIAFVRKNRQSLQEWGASGRLLVQDKYTWEAIAKNLEDYLLSL